MLYKKTNIGNTNTYDVLVLDGINDTLYKNIALLKNNSDYDPEPYVIALGYHLETGTWKNGWYYETLEQAKRSFYTHTRGGYKNV